MSQASSNEPSPLSGPQQEQPSSWPVGVRMPSKSEIEFCERWLELRGADGFDGCVVWREPLAEARFPGSSTTMELMVPIMPRPPLQPWDYLFALTPRGADLVASYEAAIEQELEVKPDDAPEPAFKAGDLVRVRPEYQRKFEKVPDGPLTILGPDGDGSWSIGPRARDYAMTEELQLVVYEPCPDCEFGRVSIPGLLSIAPVDPDHEVVQTMACPTCKGEKVVEVEAILDIGSSITGTGEVLDGLRSAWIKGTDAGAALGVINDGWKELTRVEGQRLAGRPFEARRGVDDPPRRHVASSAQPDAFAGFLRLVGGGNMRFDGTWWVRDAVADHG